MDSSSTCGTTLQNGYGGGSYKKTGYARNLYTNFIRLNVIDMFMTYMVYFKNKTKKNILMINRNNTEILHSIKND